MPISWLTVYAEEGVFVWQVPTSSATSHHFPVRHYKQYGLHENYWMLKLYFQIQIWFKFALVIVPWTTNSLDLCIKPAKEMYFPRRQMLTDHRNIRFAATCYCHPLINIKGQMPAQRLWFMKTIPSRKNCTVLWTNPYLSHPTLFPKLYQPFFGRPLPFPDRDRLSRSFPFGLVGTTPIFSVSPFSLTESPLPESLEEFFLNRLFALAFILASVIEVAGIQFPLISLFRSSDTPFSSSPENGASFRFSSS